MSFLNTLIPSFGKAGACTGGDSGTVRRPRYQIRENDDGYDLTVFLPGVTKEGLEITDEGGELRLTGKRAFRLPEGAAVLHRETTDLPYELVLDHDGSVDTAKITAELKDGVLQLTLAKAESAKPRKIAVS
jgi:HSP20 family molecular chaperone IbpA